MRSAFLKKQNIAAAVIGLLMIALCLAFTCESFAEDGGSQAAERHVWFTYSYTECTGTVHPASLRGIDYSESSGSTYPVYYSAYMMLCDSDHAIHLEGDGDAPEAGSITFTSSNPAVLSIDNSGNVTLNKTGTARITATVAADEEYGECTIYLDVKVDRHEGWDDSVKAHYVDRPAEWGLDLDTSDGPQQLELILRPGASVTYSSENPKVVSVDQNGTVTPLSAGTTQIFFDIDDGGGKYKACRIGETVKVTGDTVPGSQGEPLERHVWFTYGYTECTGKVHPGSEEGIGYSESHTSEFPEHYSVNMMLCDSDHVVRVAGDGITGASNVTFTSSNPAVLDIDSNGNVTINKTGRAEITATVAADNVYAERSVHLLATIDKHDGWIGTEGVYYEGRSPAWGLALDTSEGSQQLVVPLRPGASVSCSSSEPDVVLVDSNGVVTPVSAGTAQIRFDVDDGGGKYKAGYFYESITVTGEDIRSTQEISGDTGPFTVDVHDGLQLDLQAATDLKYSVVSGANASVSQDGLVQFTKAGSAVIKVVAVGTKEYRPAEVRINITARDYAAEEAARIAAEEEAARKAAAEEAARKAAAEAAAKKAAAEEAARKAAAAEAARKAAAEAAAKKAAAEAAAKKAAAEAAAKKAAALRLQIARAKSLKKPTLTVKALKGRKNKLTWSKVPYASGYIVYVKYPGKKKYVRAAVRNSTVKSVTHKGLSRKRVYYYKVRAYKIVNKKTYYGPLSAARKARVR